MKTKNKTDDSEFNFTVSILKNFFLDFFLNVQGKFVKFGEKIAVQ